jgi:superfamily II DNA helicase RecQ
MGIDKSNIQSVIHYDMPKSIENYVQEIGRAGRDGKLARCHMFLNNEDFFLIRRLILTDLLDNFNALKLTNKIIVEAKRLLIGMIKPELAANKKRKIKQISKSSNAEEGEEEYVHKLIDEFEHEDHLARYYVKVPGGNEKISQIMFD